MNASVEAREAILNGPDFFYCERGHARIRKEECIRRQKGISRRQGEYGRYRDIPPECVGCEQGREIKEGSKMPKTGICKECKELKKLKARGMCDQCYNAWWGQEKQKSGGMTLAERGVERGQPLPGSPLGEPGKPKVLHLDFTEVMDLYIELESLAKEELRPIEMQALFLVKVGLEQRAWQLDAKRKAEDGEE